MQNTPNTWNTISRRRFVATGMFTTLCLPFYNTVQANNGYGIQGRYAPELEVDYWIDPNGEPGQFSLADAGGKWIFLKCFQDWCPGCHAHGFPTLKKISDAFAQNSDVLVAGIQTTFEGFSTNTKDKVRKLQLRYELNIPMGHDAGDPGGDHRPSTMRNYRTGGTPWMILIDPERVVVYNDYNINAERLIEVLNEKTA